MGSESQVELLGEVDVLENGKKLQFRFQETLAFQAQCISGSENGSEIDQNRRMHPIILSYKDGAFPSDGPLLPLKSGSSFRVHKSSPISGPPKKTGRSHGIQKISNMARSAPRFNFPVVHPKVSLSGTCTLTRGEDGLIVPWTAMGDWGAGDLDAGDMVILSRNAGTQRW